MTFLPDTPSFTYHQEVNQDQSIPVYHGGPITADTALLAQAGQEVPQKAYVVWFERPTFIHQLGCACCITRSPAARALSALFRARATGNAPFFSRVVVLADQAGWADITTALKHDAFTRARFKLAANETIAPHYSTEITSS